MSVTTPQQASPAGPDLLKALEGELSLEGLAPDERPRALVLFSGGLDSSTLLALMIAALGADRVRALSISYGQRHEREIEAARAIAVRYGVPHQMLDLGQVFEGSDCSLLSASGRSVPHASYAEQRQEGELVSTYVPFRNGLFLSAAASVALSHDCSLICYGAHHDDWAGDAYPDCSADFVEAMGRAVELGSGGALRLLAPFVERSKAGIVALGLRLGVPYELTWSCYEGGSRPCGQCATCVDRAAAFAANGVADPLLTRS